MSRQMDHWNNKSFIKLANSQCFMNAVTEIKYYSTFIADSALIDPSDIARLVIVSLIFSGNKKTLN